MKPSDDTRYIGIIGGFHLFFYFILYDRIHIFRCAAIKGSIGLKFEVQQ